ncbi:H-NS histone family protein [Burkholderia anthina]|nr:H-NS histone family protein [Burkholderia anthina]
MPASRRVDAAGRADRVARDLSRTLSSGHRGRVSSGRHFPESGENRFDATGKAVVKVLPARYRDPASGRAWSGRGDAPLRIRGKDRRRFVIVRPPSMGKKTKRG